MSDELDPVRRVLASITRRELGEDALFGVFGGDRPRVGAALWRLIEGGERLPSLESVPALLRLAPYDGHALLAYLRSLDAPKWARMGNRFSKGENFRGWHADLEALVRGCADRGALIESWSEIPDPVGGCVAFALARLGELDPTSLPSESLERFARAFAEVYDYDDGHLVFEGVERIGEPARFRRAVVEAAPAPGPEVLDLLCAAFLRPSEPSVRLALKLFARGNERVRDTVRVCLLTQPLELLAPHVATLLAGDAHHRALGAELVLRHSYAPAIRELARNHRTVDPAPSSSEALLAWAAELEPELEALLARTEGVDPPDELGAIDARDDAAFADALANHADPMAAALRFVLARPDRPAVARLAVRRFAPESRAFALALFKWVYCVPPPASSLGATIRSTVDGPLLHTPGPGSLLDPVDLLCQLTGSQEVAAALWRVLAVRVWPASLEEAALEWLAWNDLEATLARLGPWLRSEPHRDGIWAVLVRAGELARPILLKLLEGDEADVRLACNVLVRAPMACAVDALARAAERWSDPIVALARDACLAQRSRVAVTDEAVAHARELAVTEVGPRLDGPVVRVEVAAGDRLILAANAGQVRVAERGRERFAIEGLHETFASLATDGSTLVVGDRLKIEIVPLDGGEPVAVSPDNGLHTALAVCGGRALTLCAYPLADTPLGLWTRDGSVHSHPIEGLPYDARLFAQGDRYLLYLDGGELSVRRIEDGATLHLLVPGAARVGPDREVRSMHLFDRDRRAATVTEDGTLRVFSTETGELLAEHRQRFVNAEVSLAFGQASPWLVVGVSTDDNDETEIHVFDRDGHPHGVIVERGEPLAARGGTALVADISDGRIWDLCTLKIAGRFTLPDEITAVAAGAEAFYAGDIEGLVWMIEAA